MISLEDADGFKKRVVAARGKLVHAVQSEALNLELGTGRGFDSLFQELAVSIEGSLRETIFKDRTMGRTPLVLATLARMAGDGEDGKGSAYQDDLLLKPSRRGNTATTLTVSRVTLPKAGAGEDAPRPVTPPGLSNIVYRTGKVCAVACKKGIQAVGCPAYIDVFDPAGTPQGQPATKWHTTVSLGIPDPEDPALSQDAEAYCKQYLPTYNSVKPHCLCPMAEDCEKNNVLKVLCEPSPEETARHGESSKEVAPPSHKVPFLGVLNLVFEDALVDPLKKGKADTSQLVAFTKTLVAHLLTDIRLASKLLRQARLVRRVHKWVRSPRRAMELVNGVSAEESVRIALTHLVPLVPQANLTYHIPEDDKDTIGCTVHQMVAVSGPDARSFLLNTSYARGTEGCAFDTGKIIVRREPEIRLAIERRTQDFNVLFPNTALSITIPLPENCPRWHRRSVRAVLRVDYHDARILEELPSGEYDWDELLTGPHEEVRHLLLLASFLALLKRPALSGEDEPAAQDPQPHQLRIRQLVSSEGLKINSVRDDLEKSTEAAQDSGDLEKTLQDLLVLSLESQPNFRQHLRFGSVSVMEVKKGERVLDIRATYGPAWSKAKRENPKILRLPLTEDSTTGYCGVHQRVVYGPVRPTDPPTLRNDAHRDHEKVPYQTVLIDLKSELLLPYRIGKRLLGVLATGSNKAETYSAENGEQATAVFAEWADVLSWIVGAHELRGDIRRAEAYRPGVGRFVDLVMHFLTGKRLGDPDLRELLWNVLSETVSPSPHALLSLSQDCEDPRKLSGWKIAFENGGSLDLLTPQKLSQKDNRTELPEQIHNALYRGQTWFPSGQPSGQNIVILARAKGKLNGAFVVQRPDLAKDGRREILESLVGIIAPYVDTDWKTSEVPSREEHTLRSTRWLDALLLDDPPIHRDRLLRDLGHTASELEDISACLIYVKGRDDEHRLHDGSDLSRIQNREDRDLLRDTPIKGTNAFTKDFSRGEVTVQPYYRYSEQWAEDPRKPREQETAGTAEKTSKALRKKQAAHTKGLEFFANAHDLSRMTVPLKMGDGTVFAVMEFFRLMEFTVHEERVMQTFVKELSAKLSDRPLVFDRDFSSEKVDTWSKIPDPTTEALKGESEAILAVRARVEALAKHDAPVLIYGERGSGRRTAALHLHLARHPDKNDPPTSERRFVALSVAETPPEQVSAELFGHTQGSDGSIRGLISSADEGTIFLNDIHMLSPDAQVRLLELLRTGEYRPVGVSKPIGVRVRIVAATHHPSLLADADRFLPELRYRLDLHTLHTPSLRQRKQDIAYLLWTIAAKSKLNLAGIQASAVVALYRYHWPGNLYKLQHLVDLLDTLGLRLQDGWLTREHVDRCMSELRRLDRVYEGVLESATAQKLEQSDGSIPAQETKEDKIIRLLGELSSFSGRLSFELKVKRKHCVLELKRLCGSQLEVCRRANIPPGTLSRWIRGM